MMNENRLKYRFITQILPPSSKNRIVLITGARQTGKTTLAKLYYSDLQYINLDAIEKRAAIREIPTEYWFRDVGNAIIDEAQKEPGVFDKIKYAYDDGHIDFQVILGSSQILLLKKIKESLAGRVSLFELWPLMLCELYFDQLASQISQPLLEHLLSDQSFNTVLKNQPTRMIDNTNLAKKDIENYMLKWGGMPGLLSFSNEDRKKWLRDYEITYLERDLSDLSRIDDLLPFRKFQKLTALRSGQLLNYSEIARDASLSVDTIRRYLEYLRISYQVILIQPFYKNITSSLIKTPKLYWLDIGLLRQLTGDWSDISGHIYETMVVSELVKWIKTMQKEVDIYFYRTRAGLELDLLLQTSSGIIGIEIKSREKLVSSDITPMKKIAEALGADWKGGIVIYRGETIQKLNEPAIWAIPSHRLFI